MFQHITRRELRSHVLEEASQVGVIFRLNNGEIQNDQISSAILTFSWSINPCRKVIEEVDKALGLAAFAQPTDLGFPSCRFHCLA